MGRCICYPGCRDYGCEPACPVCFAPAYDSRDVAHRREAAEDALREYAKAARYWNAPDDEHTRIQLRQLVEAVIAETFTEHDDTATQDPDTGAAQGGPAGQTGASPFKVVPNPEWIGPHEEWFCACRESYGNVLRPASMHLCPSVPLNCSVDDLGARMTAHATRTHLAIDADPYRKRAYDLARSDDFRVRALADVVLLLCDRYDELRSMFGVEAGDIVKRDDGPSNLDVATFALMDARHVLAKIATSARQNQIAKYAEECIARIDAQVTTA